MAKKDPDELNKELILRIMNGNIVKNLFSHFYKLYPLKYCIFDFGSNLFFFFNLCNL